MSFSERLNLVFREIGCSNSDVAKLANIHPSGISRFRNGERTPTPRNNQARSLCSGIVEYSESTGKLHIILKLLNKGEDEPKENLAGHLLMWLLKDSFSFRLFSNKLNIIMNGLNISNNTMAAAIHVDASVISRFRNNVRVPSSDSTLYNMASFIYDTAQRNNNIESLISITDMKTEVSHNKDKAVNHILSWFSEKRDGQQQQIIASFLEKIDKFTPEAFPPLPELDLIAPKFVRESKEDCYVGIDGLRRAVVRFLGNAVVSESPNTLLLYSDQTMEWMTGDSEYRKIWAALMVYTLRAKNKIRIIHNLKRSIPEMVKAIEGWLPLYMSGMLEAYIHKKEVGERFAHTLFISPAKEAVVASFPIGMEDQGEYNYYTNEKVDYYVKQHETLTSSSVPIMRIFTPGDTEGLLLLQRELAEGKGEQYRLLSSPTIETMSEKTLKSILNRINPPDDIRDRIEKHCKKKREYFSLAVKAGTIKEYVYAGDKEESANHQLNLGDLFLSEPLYYTKDEYDSHISDMKKLEKENPNYSFKLLREKYFDNLQIVSKKDSGALVVKTGKTPDISSYWHPIMANVYHSYLDELLSGKVSESHGWD